MSTNSIFIAITVALLILPATAELINRKERIKWYKRLTGWGILFYITVFLGAFLQIKQDKQNTKNEIHLLSQIDSLTTIALNNSDTINNLKIIVTSSSDTISILKGILGSIESKSNSIESQLYLTDKKVSDLGKTNDSLNQKIIESDRPQLVLYSAIITSDEFIKKKHINFSFMNNGKRTMTNVFGKVFAMYKDTVHDLGALGISRAETFQTNAGFTYRLRMTLDPDTESLVTAIYYYFKLTYSDLILKTSYDFEIARRLDPFKKGEYRPSLTLCPDWEITKMKRTIERGYPSINK